MRCYYLKHLYTFQTLQYLYPIDSFCISKVLVTLEKNDDFRSIMIAANGTTQNVSRVETDTVHVGLFYVV